MLHLCHGVFATHKHLEHTCWLCSAVFVQYSAIQANPLVVLGLGLVSGQLAVSWLPNLSNVPLAIWSLQITSVLGGGQWCYVALLFGATFWSGSCLVRFLGSGAFFSPVCIWVDILIVTRPVPSFNPRVLARCCSCWGLWPHFCYTQGPQCPKGVLSPPCSALFRASCHFTWWWTSLAFVARDALHTWWTLRYL